MRQRLRLHRSPLVFVGKGLLALLALGLLWYGGMVVALAFKASQSTVEMLSGYRAAYDFLADLTPGDLTDRTRLIVGLAGLAGFLLFGFLAFKELPRPRLARSGVDLTADGDLGATAVSPRALERVAEIAAADHPSVAVAAGRLEDDQMSLNLKLLRARELPADMRAAQRRARQALADHGVPVSAVNVTVAAFDRSNRREPS